MLNRVQILLTNYENLEFIDVAGIDRWIEWNRRVQEQTSFSGNKVVLIFEKIIHQRSLKELIISMGKI